jgi:site-specific recombinase
MIKRFSLRLLSYWQRWQGVDESQPLSQLLARADPQAAWYRRVNWLLDVVDWLHVEPFGEQISSRYARKTRRLNLLLASLDRDATTRERAIGVLRSLLQEADGLELLCATGLPREPALASEIIETLIEKLLPGTPVHRELGPLFGAVFPRQEHAGWIATLDPPTIERVRKLLFTDEMLARYRRNAEDALIYLSTVVCAIGLSPDVRSRLASRSPRASPFLKLKDALERLLEADEEGRAAAQSAVNNGLFESHAAILDAYRHLNDHGVSITLVYHLERMHAMLKRTESLLALLYPPPGRASNTSGFIVELVHAHHMRSGLMGLLKRNTALLARKMVEHNAEHGDHYIARDRDEYRGMFRAALGGGLLTGFTTWIKFFVFSMHLPKFFEGLGASLNYSFSFVAIQLTGAALATKQPAMTAPALAGQLESINTPGGLRALIDEIADLMRSQSAAVFGNIIAVVPATLIISALLYWITGHPMINEAKAAATLHSFSLLGPTPFYAAFTGVLLWSSSLFAGFADNWFALHRLHEGIAWNRRLNAVIGEHASLKVADFMQRNFSGFAANVSLGFLLGMVPAIADFMGLPLDIRHVTLSSGATAAAVFTLGAHIMLTADFWLAIAGIAVMAFLNIMVSFALAFAVALSARNIREMTRKRIYRAIIRRLYRSPAIFILPAAHRAALRAKAEDAEDVTTRFIG